MSATLQLDALGKQRHPPDGSWLFRDVSASIREPAIVSILGKSGQGKSTLLRIIGRLTAQDQGSVLLDGRKMEQWSPIAWRMRISYVAQTPVMLPGSVEDNLRAASMLHQRPFDRKQARQWLEQIGLEYLDWSKPAEQLSGGEKQRLALVRTLLLQPAILLLDEVTSSLDGLSKQAADTLLVDLHANEGTTILWVTHDLEEARTTSSRVWFMAEGRLLEDAQSEAFFAAPATEQAQIFFAQPAFSLDAKRGRAVMTYPSMWLAAAFVLIALFLSLRQKMGMEKEILIATIRCTVQLLVIGYVLQVVFQSDNPLFVILILVMMITAAAWNASRRGTSLPGIFWRIFVSLAVTETVTMGMAGNRSATLG